MRKVYISLMVLFTSFVLVACGSGDRGGNTGAKLVEWYELDQNAVFDTETPVTINFWHRMGAASAELLAEWIAEFKEIYPNITVNAESVASDYGALLNKVSLAITAGSGPHIAESYPDHIARYAKADAPLALNNFISHPVYGMSEEEVNDFLPGLWAESTGYDNAGTVLSLPFSKSSEALFYNSSYFEQHGYEVPKTWDQLFAIAEDIKQREPDSVPFGYDSTDNLFITGAKQWDAPYTGYNEETGVGEVLFNNSKAKEMVKYFKDKVDRGLMLTRALNGDAYTSDIVKTNTKMYMYVGSTGGTRYAYIGASASVIQAGYRIGVAPLPGFTEESAFQIQQGPNINLFKKDNEQEMIASWLFAKFITSAEKSVEFGMPSGYAPTRKSSYETQMWLDYVADIESKPNPTASVDLQNKLVKEAIEIFNNYQNNFFTSAVFNLSSKTRTEVGALMDKILSYEGNDLDGYIDDQFQDSYDFIIN